MLGSVESCETPPIIHAAVAAAAGRIAVFVVAVPMTSAVALATNMGSIDFLHLSIRDTYSSTYFNVLPMYYWEFNP